MALVGLMQTLSIEGVKNNIAVNCLAPTAATQMTQGLMPEQALAAVWPQGLGARSPGPFGHTPVQQTAQAKAAMQRETQASEQRIKAAREAVADIQAQKLSPTK